MAQSDLQNKEIRMAEGGVKPDFSEPEDDHVVQTLRKELGLIKGQIELAQKRQDTEEELRKEIESAKAQLAALSQIHDVGTGTSFYHL